jgi:hypothetical protein
MELNSYFTTFLRNIRPTDPELKDYQQGHSVLRERLGKDEKIKELMITTFLQGSYRRHTAIKAEAGQRSDVDIVVVTKFSPTDSPKRALEFFEPFCEKHYKGKWKRNDRSIGIELDRVSLDLVVTAAPSEAEEGLLKSASWVHMDELPRELNEARLVKGWMALGGPMNLDSRELQKIENAAKADWKNEPLLIPDREFEKWDRTHPLAQIEWTWEKNLDCNQNYINVVKAIKWWKRIRPDELPKYPKGYPLEHLIGAACPNGIDSVAEGVTRTLEEIVRKYPTKPKLADHGVPEHDVMKRISDAEYSQFLKKIKEAAGIARAALDAEDLDVSGRYWQKLFGEEFPTPEPDESGGRGGFTKRDSGSTIAGGNRFA